MSSTLMEQLIKPNTTTHRTWVRTGLIPIPVVFGGKQAIPSDMLRNTASISSISATSYFLNSHRK
jgi:hypothetical protein